LPPKCTTSVNYQLNNVLLTVTFSPLVFSSTASFIKKMDTGVDEEGGRRRRVFVSNLDGHLGLSLAEKFASEKGWEVCGSLGRRSKNSGRTPSLCAEVAPSGSCYDLALSSDVIVLCTLESTADAEDIVTELQLRIASPNQTEVHLPSRLLLVAGLGTWDNTWKQWHQGQEEQASSKQDDRILYEDDYLMRRPSSIHGDQFQLEQAVLRLDSPSGRMRTAVIGAAAAYGRGEGPFQQVFSQAWNGHGPVKLPCRSRELSENCRPLLVYMGDLCESVAAVALQPGPPQKPYMLAIDHDNDAERPSLCKICKTVTTTFRGVLEDHLWEQILVPMSDDEYLEFSIGCPSYASQLLSSLSLSLQGGGALCHQARGEKNIFEMQDTVRQEFLEHHSLQPVRILVTGPPGARVNDMCSALSAAYGIPQVGLKCAGDALLVACGLPVPDPPAPGDEVTLAPKKTKDAKATPKATKKRESLVEDLDSPLENRLLTRMQAALESAGISTADSTYGGASDARLADVLQGDLAVEIFQWFLRGATCQQRGFICKDYPMTAGRVPASASEALSCFLLAPEESEDATDDGDERGLCLDEALSPTHIMLLAIPQSKAVEDPELIARYNAYCEAEDMLLAADEEGGEPAQATKQLPRTLREIEEKTGLRPIVLDDPDPEGSLPLVKAMQALTCGRMPGWVQEERKATATPLAEEHALPDQPTTADTQQEELPAQEPLPNGELAIIAALSGEDRELLGEKTALMRRYLLDNVGAEVTRALLELSALPEGSIADPIDWLADYLIREGDRKQRMTEAQADLRFRAGAAILAEQHRMAMTEANGVGG
jgi:hypothetical protein